MIEVELPDGRVLEIDTDDQQQAASAARKFMQSQQGSKQQQQQQQQEPSFLESAANFGAEVSGGLQRGVPQLYDATVTAGYNKLADLTGLPQAQPIQDIVRDATGGALMPEKGAFLGEGAATDIASMAGEFASGGGALSGGFKQLAKTLPESTAKSVAGALGGSGAASESVTGLATGAASGAGQNIGGAIGDVVGGEEGRAIGEVVGGLGAGISTGALFEARKLKMPQESIKDATAKKILRENAPTAQNLKSAASNIYKEIDDLGGFYQAKDLAKLADDVTEEMTEFGISQSVTPKGFGAMQEILSNTDKNQTVKGLDNIRKVSSNLATSSEPAEREVGRRLSGLIDKFMDEVSPTSIKTGKELYQISSKIKDARKIWRQARKSQLLEDAMDRGMRAASGEQNGIKNQFRSLLNNKSTSKLWSDTEKKMMESVIKGDLAENTLRYMGTMGFPVDQARNWLGSSLSIGAGATFGGAAGAIALPIIGTVSRGLSQKLTMNKSAMAKAVVTAGDNGLDIVKAYLKNTKPADRSADDIAQLLSREGISKTKIRPFADSLGKKNRKMILDAVLFSSSYQNNNNEEQ